jgi:hypothetical protein
MKKLAIVLSIILGTVVVAGGAVAAYDYTILRDFVGLGLPHNTVEAVKVAYTNTNNLAGYHFENNSFAKATIPTANVEAQSLSLPLTVSGDYVKPDKSQFVADLKTKDIIDATIPLISSAIPGGAGIKNALTPDIKKQLEEVKVEGIIIGDNLYIQAPLAFKDQWIQISTANLALTKEQLAELQNINYGQYADSVQKLNDEKVDGVKCYHYQVKIDVVKVLSSSVFKDLPQSDLNIVKSTIKNNEVAADVYIGRRDLVVHKDNLDFKMTSPILIELGIVNQYSNFNQVADIQPPANAKKAESITPTDIASSVIGQLVLKVYLPDAKTRDLKRKSDLKIINDALKQYSRDHQGKYPVLTDTSKDGKFLEILVPKYLAAVPLDPLNPEYFYSYKSNDGVHYILSATLENKSDTQAKNGVYQLSN